MPNWGDIGPQSPIEQRLADAMDAAGISYGCQKVVSWQYLEPFCRSKYHCRCGLPRQDEYGDWSEGDDYCSREIWEDCDWAVSGKRVPRYIVDFAIVTRGGNLAIECDGKNFHSGSQVEKDVRRQVAIEKDGWKVVRFTGSEIYQDVVACVLRVLDEIAALQGVVQVRGPW